MTTDHTDSTDRTRVDQWARRRTSYPCYPCDPRSSPLTRRMARRACLEGTSAPLYTAAYANTVTRRLLDPSPGVAGMSSIRKLKLLRLAFSCLDSGEGYLEIGAFQG